MLAVDWTLIGNRTALAGAALTAFLYLWKKVLLPGARLVTWWDRYGVKAMARIETELSNNGGSSVKDRLERIEERTAQKTEMAEANAVRLAHVDECLTRLDGRLSRIGTRLSGLEHAVEEHVKAHR